MNIKEIRKIAIEKLIKSNIEDSNIKISILLQHLLSMSKTEIMLHENMELEETQKEEIFKCVEEIITGKPIQYITHHQEFMGLDFYVDKNVLIPQPDTEILVEETIHMINRKTEDIITKLDASEARQDIENCKSKNKEIKILDLCTGSGAIAVSIENYVLDRNLLNKDNNIISKKAKQNIEIYASDISAEALEIARKNAILNNEETNIRFIKSNMFENINDKFDIIVSNPPYIETQTIANLSKEVQNEPHIALDGGEDGLVFYRIIAKEAKKHLNTKRMDFIRDRI